MAVELEKEFIEEEEINEPDDELDGDFDQEEPDDDPDNGEEEEPEDLDDPEEDESGEEDELIVSFEGEAPPQDDDEDHRDAPIWVRNLRKKYKEEQKRRRELEAELAKSKAPEAPQHGDPGRRPSIEDAGYDPDEHEKMLDEWEAQKKRYEAQQTEQQLQQKKQEEAWVQKISSYEEQKKKLNVKNFEDAEEFVKETFSQGQQGMIISGAENPAMLVYALSKYPAKAAELASITDPVQFAFATAKLETKLKPQGRKAKTNPEKQITGTGKLPSSNDKKLEALEREADKTGDRTEVIAYKKLLQQQGK